MLCLQVCEGRKNIVREVTIELYCHSSNALTIEVPFYLLGGDRNGVGSLCSREPTPFQSSRLDCCQKGSRHRVELYSVVTGSTSTTMPESQTFAEPRRENPLYPVAAIGDLSRI